MTSIDVVTTQILHVATFRARRIEFGLSRMSLSRAAGLSGAYVQQLETGRLKNPSAEARSALAHVLDLDPDVLFAGFPTCRGDVVAHRRRHELKLYREGKSHLQIAALLGIPSSLVAHDLKSSQGYKPRTSSFTFIPDPGRITATEAAKAHGVDVTSLCQAIDSGRVRGRRHPVAGGQVIRTVDPVQLAEDLAALPVCRYQGCAGRGVPPCAKKALAASGACSGPHARALEMVGVAWSKEAVGKRAAAIRGRPRPDLGERDAAMHSDPKRHREWLVRLYDGRMAAAESRLADGSPRTLLGGRARGVTGTKRRKVKYAYNGALNGQKATTADYRQKRGRPREYTGDQAQRLRALSEKHPSWGRGTLAAETGLTEKQVRSILGPKARARPPGTC